MVASSVKYQIGYKNNNNHHEPWHIDEGQLKSKLPKDTALWTRMSDRTTLLIFFF
jgi:hypothetical protein